MAQSVHSTVIPGEMGGKTEKDASPSTPPVRVAAAVRDTREPRPSLGNSAPKALSAAAYSAQKFGAQYACNSPL